MNTINVAVLGATGTVGQKFITLLEGHPYFKVAEVVASPRSAGKRYDEATNWKQDNFIPTDVANLVVKSTDDALESKILFSGMDASVAGEIEEKYAAAGHIIISNARNHRMNPVVPLAIPEINHDHLNAIKTQPWKGGIITNSNCSTMFLAMVLAPLHKAFGIDFLHVTTMQAISGAGYPGVASMDILGNVVPFIGGEEEKMEIEAQKILGSFDGEKIISADFKVSAQCNRVPVFDGHTETLSIKFKKSATPEEVKEVLRNFRGFAQEKNLPSAPAQPIIVFEEENRPQPARDVWKGNGMATCVGRIRKCPLNDVKMVIMGHNTVRGAAGAAILNAEAIVEMGLV
ncbi:MAG: aspartate-semialdehyde dehydrogenase [Spirochaetales bacterium]|nr:aspartate-semialdehyde dehydrogenase [Spirochaetales bacterium]